MNRKILTKKYKRKSSRKSSKTRRRVKTRKSSKNRRRVLKGGVRPSSFRPSDRPSSGVTVNSRASSVRPSSGISNPSIPSKCCKQKSVVNQQKIISSINNFPHTFDIFYDELLLASYDELPEIIEKFKLEYSEAITIQPQGAYLNINGLKFINYLRSKFVNSTNQDEKDKIKIVISLLDQYGAAPGVRISDLEVIKKQLDSRYFECYKKLYEDIYGKLFKCDNDNCYPLSTSAISLYCRTKTSKALKTIHE
jgi:hypothetical protein